MTSHRHKRVLTGMKPSGIPHLGNYLGMLKQSVELMNSPFYSCFYFIADLHALNTVQDPVLVRDYSYKAAATWLALGVDPERVVFYRESDIPEIVQLTALLAPVVPKSLLNQAHAYKTLVAKNQEQGSDSDDGVNMGLFNYPLLMAADILAFDIDLVPVGRDQQQHIEIARDIARRFNVRFGDHLLPPEALIEEEMAVIPGTDGRKMSKSYDNVIPLFLSPRAMEKAINAIVTDATPVDAPKDPSTSTLFALYQAFATPQQVSQMRERYASGIGWGQVKKELFAAVQDRLAKPCERYQQWLQDLPAIEVLLQQGAERARIAARETYHRIAIAVGLR